jgi:hypothetical protein
MKNILFILFFFVGCTIRVSFPGLANLQEKPLKLEFSDPLKVVISSESKREEFMCYIEEQDNTWQVVALNPFGIVGWHIEAKKNRVTPPRWLITSENIKKIDPNDLLVMLQQAQTRVKNNPDITNNEVTDLYISTTGKVKVKIVFP